MYSRIRYDIFFKKIFQQEHLLKAFLNTVLSQELPSPIRQLTYQPTEFITKAERQSVNLLKHAMIDVFVTTETGTRALVEIQKGTEPADLIRFIDYQCRNFSHQFRVGDDYTHPIPCYSICWLFDMTPPHRDFKEKLTITSDKPRTAWQVAWEMIAIYPRCIRKEHLKRKTLDALEEWLLLDVVTDISKAKAIKRLIQTKEVQEAFEQLDLSGLTEEELEELEFQEAIAERYKTSYERRLQQNKTQTEKENTMEIARKMLFSGIERHLIQQTTGLNEEEMRTLQPDA